jgi:transcriptional repressor NrdR
MEEVPLVVVKSDGSTQPFDRDKIVFGVRAASKGRSVTEEQIEQLASDVEDEVRCAGGEVSSSRIGLAVLDRLRVLDEVAYLRFASVYKNFDAASDFQSELELLSKLSTQSPV